MACTEGCNAVWLSVSRVNHGCSPNVATSWYNLIKVTTTLLFPGNIVDRAEVRQI